MIKVGVVGVGHMGEYHVNLLKQLESMGMIVFSGVFDIDTKRMGYVSNKYNVKAYENLDEFLMNSEAAICAVWSTKHYEVGKKILETGLHLLIEKPFATKYGDSLELVNIAKKKKLILQVGHVERFKGPIIELKKKYIKKTIYIESERLNLRSKKYRDTGVVLDLMVHDLDIIFNFFDDQIYDIHSSAKKIYTDYEDFCIASLVFKSGLTALLKTSRASFISRRTLSISQEHNFIMLNFDTQEIEMYSDANTRFDVDQKELIYFRGGLVQKIMVHTENALKNELVHFINCITGAEKQIYDNETDCNVLKTALLIMKSSAQKFGIPYDGDI